MSKGERIPIAKLAERLEKEIQRKARVGGQQDIDSEVLGYISVYRHGAPKYKLEAMDWLINFAVNADIVANKKSVIKL